MLVGNRVCVGLTRSAINPMLSSYFPVKGAGKLRPHGNEPPAARTGLRSLNSFSLMNAKMALLGDWKRFLSRTFTHARLAN